MSGILNSKTRVLDTIVTLEGRRQLSQGGLNIAYASFTDGATFYKADLISGSADASDRLYLEQCNLPQDQIVFKADDSGRLRSIDDGTQVKDGQVLVYSFDPTMISVLSGTNQDLRVLSGSEFASTADSLLASSVDNFQKLRVIGTSDKIFEDDGFKVGNTNIQFNINDQHPISDVKLQATHLDHVESLFSDPRFSRTKNFKYLPPINKTGVQAVGSGDNLLGNYPPFGRTTELTGQVIEEELQVFAKQGYVRTLTFDPTSRDNRLIAQFFEVNFNVMKKLDVVDFGSYAWLGSTRRAFFIGKVMIDQNGSDTFVHLFTLIFG